MVPGCVRSRFDPCVPAVWGMELVPALCNGGSDSRVEFWRGRSRGTPAELEASGAVPRSAGFVQKL